MASQVGGGVRLAPASNYIVQGAGSNDMLFFASGSNQGFTFGTSNNSNLLLRVGSNGFVGFGLSNPLFKVDIAGDLNFSGALRQGGVPYVGSQWSNSSSNVFVLGSNVGIGVSAPLAALHVACNLRVDGSVTMFNSISMPAVYFTPGNSANTNTSQIVLATSNIQGYSNLVWGASGSNGTMFSIMSNTSNDVFRWVSGAASNTAMSLSGNGNLAVSGTVTSSNESFMKNRVINGDMRIANRGTSVTGTGNAVANAPCDQWTLNYSITTGGFTMTQIALTTSDIPYANGFRHSLKIQATTACTSYAYIQPTQSFDHNTVLADLGWGTASGTSVAISFWLRTNLANSSVIPVSLRNGTLAYSYNVPVTITNSSGWQYVTLVVPSPPAATPWGTTTELMIGARYNAASATAGSWTNNNNLGINGAVDLWATLNNYVEITGVQLERGTVPTPFEFRTPVVESLLNGNLVLGSVGANGLGTATPTTALDVNGTSTLRGLVSATAGMSLSGTTPAGSAPAVSIASTSKIITSNVDTGAINNFGLAAASGGLQSGIPSGFYGWISTGAAMNAAATNWYNSVVNWGGAYTRIGNQVFEARKWTYADDGNYPGMAVRFLNNKSASTERSWTPQTGGVTIPNLANSSNIELLPPVHAGIVLSRAYTVQSVGNTSNGWVISACASNLEFSHMSSTVSTPALSLVPSLNCAVASNIVASTYTIKDRPYIHGWCYNNTNNFGADTAFTWGWVAQNQWSPASWSVNSTTLSAPLDGFYHITLHTNTGVSWGGWGQNTSIDIQYTITAAILQGTVPQAFASCPIKSRASSEDFRTCTGVVYLNASTQFQIQTLCSMAIRCDTGAVVSQGCVMNVSQGNKGSLSIRYIGNYSMI